jgi:hypothetical protein
MATEAEKPVMEERTEPRFVQFGTAGECVDGILRRIEKIEINGKRVVRFVVEDPSGEYLAFLGTADLLNKLRTDDVGKRIDVRYEGEDQNIRKNGNAMKRFKVRVEKIIATATREHPFAITDEDVPF